MKPKNLPESTDEVTLISNGVTIEGKLISQGNVRVDGSIQGDVKANGNVTIGERGEVLGEVDAEVINVGGRITGSVKAREKLILESKSVLKGDIFTKILVVEAGAKFDGNSSMSQKEGKPESKPPIAKTPE